MPVGPGKYDDLCTQARLGAKAQGALLLIFGGEHGEGFSCQLPPELLMLVPSVLRRVADDIERDGRRAMGMGDA